MVVVLLLLAQRWFGSDKLVFQVRPSLEGQDWSASVPNLLEDWLISYEVPMVLNPIQPG